MRTDDKNLSPFGQQIADDVAMSEVGELFTQLISKFKEHSDLIYEKYLIMQQEFKKENLDEFKDKIVLTQGDEDLYYLLERAAFRMMSMDTNLHDMGYTYSNFCDLVARYSRIKTGDINVA